MRTANQFKLLFCALVAASLGSCAKEPKFSLALPFDTLEVISKNESLQLQAMSRFANEPRRSSLPAVLTLSEVVASNVDTIATDDGLGALSLSYSLFYQLVRTNKELSNGELKLKQSFVNDERTALANRYKKELFFRQARAKALDALVLEISLAPDE